MEACFSLNFSENSLFFAGDRFASDYAHHQAFQALSATSGISFRQAVSGYSDKSAAFVRSSRRFLVPRDQLFTRALRIGRQLSRRPTTTRGAQLSSTGGYLGRYHHAAWKIDADGAGWVG